MGQDHLADLVRELEAPCTHEGEEHMRVDDGRLLRRRVRHPSHLQRGGDDEGDQVEEGLEGGFACGLSCFVYVSVAGEDVEGQSGSTEDHEGFVKRVVGDYGSNALNVNEPCGRQDSFIPKCGS